MQGSMVISACVHGRGLPLQHSGDGSGNFFQFCAKIKRFGAFLHNFE